MSFLIEGGATISLMASCPFMAIAQAMDASEKDSKKTKQNSALKCPFSGKALEDELGDSSKSRKSSNGETGPSHGEKFADPEERKKALSAIGSSNGSLRSVSQQSIHASQAGRSRMSGQSGSLASGIKTSLPAGSK